MSRHSQIDGNRPQSSAMSIVALKEIVNTIGRHGRGPPHWQYSQHHIPCQHGMQVAKQATPQCPCCARTPCQLLQSLIKPPRDAYDKYQSQTHALHDTHVCHVQANVFAEEYPSNKPANKHHNHTSPQCWRVLHTGCKCLLAEARPFHCTSISRWKTHRAPCRSANSDMTQTMCPNSKALHGRHAWIEAQSLNAAKLQHKAGLPKHIVPLSTPSAQHLWPAFKIANYHCRQLLRSIVNLLRGVQLQGLRC